jgi:hypothetical protein
MSRKIFIIVVACVGLMMFFACEQKYQGKLMPMLDNSTGKWGYADTLGKNVIKPQWDMRIFLSCTQVPRVRASNDLKNES